MGNRDVAELLLERGADPNKGDNYGETPLDIARHHGQMDIVNMMQALRGADSSESESTCMDSVSDPREGEDTRMLSRC